jgi:hypothetical protein
VPKRCQEYQNISKDIELHRNPKCPKNNQFSAVLLLSALYVFLPLPIHGRSQRFKSSIAHSVLFSERILYLHPPLAENGQDAAPREWPSLPEFRGRSGDVNMPK